jgi:ABC-type branched-subunit amino acid transport system substrate-binding protein
MLRLALVLLLAALAAACAPRYADLPMTPTQSMAEAEDALRRGEYSTAISGFAEYLATGEPTFRARAMYEMAQAQYGLENYEAALDILSDLEEEYPNENPPQIPALRGDIYYALGRRTDAIRQWDIAWERGNDGDRQFLRTRIEEAIGELTPSEAIELAGEVQSDDVRAMLTSRTPGALVATENAELDVPPLPITRPSTRAPAEELPPPAKSQLNPPESPAAVEAAAMATQPQENLTIGAGDALDTSARVASLLPLTGSDRAYGQRALSGLRLAYSSFPRMLMVRDTGGDPDLASQLMAAIASDPDVLAIIGPLRSSDAAVVAPLAERLQIPVLLLARGEGLTGPYVLQTATTQQEQMRTLASYAVQTLGLVRLGVLFPDDAYGRSFMTAFSDEATRAGATVVRTNTYQTGQASFGPQAAAVRGWVSADGIQAVFIPDAAPTAVKVAEAARGAAPQIQLLGSESWNDPAVLAAAGKGIDGAVFADSFFIGSGTPSTTDFVARFRALNGRDPTGFEARAYDAGMLVREAIGQGARTRGAVLQYLRNLNGYRGAGSIPSGAGDLKPDLVLLQVRDGHVATVSQ